ncbi:MAG: plastocyanin/azurin family copper-binding protein [Pseudomonadota bacterium]
MKKLCTSLLSVIFSVSAFAGTAEVRIEKMKFVPHEIRIKVGDTVVWKSYEQRGYHTVWFKSEGLAASEPMFPEESWQRTFDQKGEYRYRCGPHEEMTGVVVVE